jgi:deazaflavin-dependent oxidoreductase (nitroreductase family)
MTTTPGADAVNEFNQALIDEYRATGGKVTGMFQDAPLLLLTMKGAKTGRERTTPLAYTEDDGRLVVIASKAGAPNNPAWYHNLVANPDATVELGTEKFPVRASVADDEERERLYRKQAERLPTFNDYEKKTTRKIPVIILERAS